MKGCFCWILFVLPAIIYSQQSTHVPDSSAKRLFILDADSFYVSVNAKTIRIEAPKMFYVSAILSTDSFNDNYLKKNETEKSEIIYTIGEMYGPRWATMQDNFQSELRHIKFLSHYDELHDFGYTFNKLDGLTISTDFAVITPYLMLGFYKLNDSIVDAGYPSSNHKALGYKKAWFVIEDHLKGHFLIMDLSDLKNPSVAMFRFGLNQGNIVLWAKEL